jgi:anhydro-N-acetylmuramic acid kinase
MKRIGNLFRKRRRRLVGLMSGTSADGVDAVVVEVETLSSGPQAGSLTWELLDFLTVPYDDAVRAEILAVQEGGDRVLERITRLHFILGHLFSDAVEKIAEDAGTPLATIDAVASHGQTVCHFPYFEDAPTGWTSASTLQIGEPSVMAERLGIPVVSNFRSRDIAAGGTGAPLVPLVDHLVFSHPERSRLVLNVGGIANVTALRAGGSLEDVMAFDTGPGNMVIDALMGILSDGQKHVDLGGGLARKGAPDKQIATEVLEDPFFSKAPPKAFGREQFGDAFTRAFLERCRAADLSRAAILATGTWLTARAVYDAYDRFIRPGFEVKELIVSGGGAHNVALLEYLTDVFHDVSVVTSDYYGMDVDAKEATSFALLAHLSIEGEAGNLPSVTGATHPVILGTITPGDTVAP